MYLPRWSIFSTVILFTAALVLAQQVPHRVEHSPYPRSVVPQRLYLIQSAWPGGKKLAVRHLQGLLAATRPELVIDWNTLWIRDLQANHGVELDSSLYSDFEGLINRFRDRISGYVLCELHTNSCNVAIALGGIRNAVAVTVDELDVMQRLNIAQIADVRGRTESWLLDTLGAEFSTTVVGWQNPADGRLFNVLDYTAMSRAFQFWAPPGDPLTSRAFDRMQPGGLVMGYPPDEYAGVKALSARGIVLHPSDWACNLSVYTNMSIEQLRQKPPAQPFRVVEGVHTVCFLISDGDNVQWLINDAGNRGTFANPKLSQINLGWTFPPALCELAPTIMQYYYDVAASGEAGRTCYVAGPSGRGYFFPELSPGLEEECLLMGRIMAKAGLRIVNVLDTDNASRRVAPFLAQPGIDAVFYYDYSNHYAGYGHSIRWSQGKPVVTGRHALWGGTRSSSAVAALLDTQSTDIHSDAAYSLIPVCVWSMNVDSVAACIEKLGPQVRVVPPDEFVWLIRTNLVTDSSCVWTFDKNSQGWSLAHAGGPYDDARWTGTVGKGGGSVMLDGSDLGASNTAPNAWMERRIDLAGAIAASIAFDLHAGLASGNDALWQVSVQNESGTWQVLHSWSPVTAADGWRRVSCDLATFTGQQILVRIQQDDDGDGSGEAVFVDNIELRIERAAVSAVPNQHAGTESSGFRLIGTRLECMSAGQNNPGVVRLALYTPRGVCLENTTGTFSVSGTPAIELGTVLGSVPRLAAGVYLVRIQTGSAQHTFPLMIRR